MVRALQNMPCFDINQVFISYIDLMDPTARRIEHLYKHYYFTCQVRVLLYSELQSAEDQTLFHEKIVNLNLFF